MKIKMYTRNHCSYCYAAKQLLTKRGLAYDEVLLSNDDEEAEMRALTGRRSVPQILIDDLAIGGYTELVELDMDGELERQA